MSKVWAKMVSVFRANTVANFLKYLGSPSESGSKGLSARISIIATMPEGGLQAALTPQLQWTICESVMFDVFATYISEALIRRLL